MIDDDLLAPTNEAVLHWLPEIDAWEWIAWEEWAALRQAFGLPLHGRGIAGLAEGVRHFLVVIYWDEDCVPVNLIPHRYRIGLGGRIDKDDTLAALTPQEDEERWRLRHRRANKSHHLRTWCDHRHAARYDALCLRQYRADLPPRASLPALRRMLRPPKPGSSAARFFAHLNDDA
jgi:hypothetical protein